MRARTVVLVVAVVGASRAFDLLGHHAHRGRIDSYPSHPAALVNIRCGKGRAERAVDATGQPIEPLEEAHPTRITRDYRASGVIPEHWPSGATCSLKLLLLLISFLRPFCRSFGCVARSRNQAETSASRSSVMSAG